MLDKQYNNNIIIIFHLLLYMAEMLSSLIDRERRPIRIEFLTLKAKLTHTPGAPMGHPKQPFPFLPGSWIRATPSSTWPHGLRMAPGHASMCTCQGTNSRGWKKVHLPVQSGTELTDYHILGMWLVRSNA